MKIIVQENYIIPQSPEGKKYADDLGGYLLIKGLFKERTADNVHIYVIAEVTLDVAKSGKKIKEAVLELRDNGGTATQKEVSGFLLNLMDALDGEAVEDVKKVTEKNLPSADNDSLYQKLNEAHNEGYDVGYWAGRRDYEQK